ncbi:MAG: hypothetical protein JSV49_04945 [Thermoplasmata archaeon]|nr:MAG: hypothetical protein JSV49_04945 [Thermoplasmata archaeon]
MLLGHINIETIFNELKPLFKKEGETILKTSKRYIESDNSSILVESMAIEGGNKTDFLTLIGKRDDGIVIRISPLKEVEKTNGLKRILAETAKQIMSNHPEYTVGKTNLNEWL